MNIALNWLFIPRIQTAGAALATCISYITVFLYRSFDTRKYLNIDMLKKEYIVSVVLMIIMGFIGVYVGYIFQEVKHRPVYIVRPAKKSGGEKTDE